jgi:hypothetical protein
VARDGGSGDQLTGPDDGEARLHGERG